MSESAFDGASPAILRSRWSLQDALPHLPQLLRRVSLARAQIIVDQLSSALGEQVGDQGLAAENRKSLRPHVGEEETGNLVSLVGEPLGELSAGVPKVVLLAIRQPPTDTATLICAGAVGAARLGDDVRLAWQISQTMRAMEHQLHRLGVRFLQWATDPVRDDTPDTRQDAPSRASPDSDRWWAQRLGMQQLANLDYLIKDLDGPPHSAATDHRLSLEPMDWNHTQDLTRWVELVAQTYEGTLDCPQLTDFRTANQMIESYRCALTFEPRWWFWVRRSSGRGRPRSLDEDLVGVLILARHRGADSSPCVAELVYMGLTPSVRGVGLGRELVDAAIDRISAAGAGRLILAVDQSNRPARGIYQRAGFSSLLREAVFVKSL